MQAIWGKLTIGASPVQIPAAAAPGQRVAKIRVQSQPGNTGNAKVGGAGLTSDNTTPGTWIPATAATNPDTSIQPGGQWSIESDNDADVIDETAYYFHGTHAGDVLNYELHIS